MKTIKENVKSLLQEYLIARDSEADLFYYYYTTFTHLDNNTSMRYIFMSLKTKTIPSMQTLMRISRQLQEQNPELRGLEWEKRQRKQKKVKEDLGYNVNS